MPDALSLQGQLQDKLKDPRFWTLMFFFVMGIISIIASIESDWIIIGPVAEWLDDILVSSLFGPMIVGFLVILISVFFFQVMLALITGEMEYISFGGILTSGLIIGIMFFLIFGMRAMLGEGDPGQVFSIISPFSKLVGGP